MHAAGAAAGVAAGRLVAAQGAVDAGGVAGGAEDGAAANAAVANVAAAAAAVAAVAAVAVARSSPPDARRRVACWRERDVIVEGRPAGGRRAVWRIDAPVGPAAGLLGSSRT
jgi:hypothetical protein